MKYDEFIGLTTGFRKIEYSWRDVILYALGVGAKADELNYIYEKNLKVLPTFGTLPCFNTIKNEPQRPLPYPASEILVDRFRRETGGDVNGLHMSIEMIIHRPIDPIKGTLLYEDVIENIYDWGDKGVIIKTKMPVYDEAGRLLCENISTSGYFHGGNFGGESLPKVTVDIPDRQPDYTVEDQFLEIQNYLYRLSGDTNLGHADPEAARRYGQPRPFMQGLCTYGMACRMAIGAVCRDKPEEIAGMYAQMRSIVLPGDRVTLSLWKISDKNYVFQLRNSDSGKVVLDKGKIQVR